MLGDVKLAKQFSTELFNHGIFAKAIGYPTVAQGKARIRIMNSAIHSRQDLQKALFVFIKVGKNLKVIK
jgi:glycine C-acetyltransferase